jgi:hypothetical protein
MRAYFHALTHPIHLPYRQTQGVVGRDYTDAKVPSLNTAV